MKSFRKFSQRKENRDYMNQEESVYELNRIQRYIMQMRPLLKKNALFSDGTADYRQPVEPDAGDEVTVRFRTKIGTANNNNFFHTLPLVKSCSIKLSIKKLNKKPGFPPGFLSSS